MRYSIVLFLAVSLAYAPVAMSSDANTPPSIAFTAVPAYGSSSNLKGVARNADPAGFAVAVYIQVEGQWWTKPYWDTPLTALGSDGAWECDITTGGIDETATKIAAFLIPAKSRPPLAAGDLSLPAELGTIAVARAEAGRKGEVSVTPATAAVSAKLRGVCYGPFRDNQDPDKGVLPSTKEIGEDVAFISRLASSLRTYGVGGSQEAIPELCEKHGVDCYPGAWLGKYKTENRKEIDALIRIGKAGLKHTRALIVGNEVLLREDMSEQELAGFIREVKAATGLPVTTAEIWGQWLKHPGLAREVDFLLVHIHPYWEGVAADKAGQHVLSAWRQVSRSFPGKKIVIGETGWPTAGKAVGGAEPSTAGQARFIGDFLSLAGSEGISYFFFEAFDEMWKKKFEGEAGAFWGIFQSNGPVKPRNKPFLAEEALAGMTRPPGKFLPVQAQAPLVVYGDADGQNAFQPSGWMGDTKAVSLERECESKPHSGKTCIKIGFSSGFFSEGWAGIYWQFPLNNWGEYPGYVLKGASKLTFWARGEKGGEKAEFKVGGVQGSGLPFRDSFGPVSDGVVTLTAEWKQYSISLNGTDTSSVIGGFCWVTNRMENPVGCTIYIDDIQFEP